MKNKIFHLRQTGSFSVTDPFLTTFYYVEKQNGTLRKNREEGFEKSYVVLQGGRGVKNCQNHSYVINEWALTCGFIRNITTVIIWASQGSLLRAPTHVISPTLPSGTSRGRAYSKLT